MKEEIIKDFGSWSVPESWNEVSLKTYEQLEVVYEDTKTPAMVDIIAAITGRNKDEVEQLPVNFIESLLQRLEWLIQQPKWPEPSNKITIDNEEYVVHFENQLKVGEYVAFDTVIKSDPHNYAAMLAIICRKDGEIYDSKFENEVLPERIKLFEKQPVMKVMAIVSFFLQLYEVLTIPTLLSSEAREEINRIQEDIENSKANGDLSALSTKLLMRKLKKLRKSISSI